MSATSTVVPTHATVDEKEWVKLFPKQVTESHTNSVTFIKQLTSVAISTITYLKNAFPEDSYNEENFAGLRMKILKDKCDDEMAQFVSNTVKQMFDALDKKYVHQLALCFYNGDCIAENLIEYYIFEYSYNSEGITLNINSKNKNNAKKSMKYSMDSVKTRTEMLVRSLSLFFYQHCTAELPVNFDVSLRLYYKEDAPEDYQAPGFRNSSEPDHLESLPDALCLGWVQTPYHKLITRAFVRDVYADSDADMPSDTRPEIAQAKNDEFQESPTRGGPYSDSSLETVLRCPSGMHDAAGQALVTCGLTILEPAIKKFVRMDAQENTMADRMMAETETSDPIEEVISPIQKVTLNSNLGTVAHMLGLEDQSSQELRELDLPSKDTTEDLPLSGSHNPVKMVGKGEKRFKRNEEVMPPKSPRLTRSRARAGILNLSL